MALRENAGRKVLIEGHPDNVGSDETNQELSQRRAQSVLAGNDDANGRQSNRLVELIFTEDQPRIAADQP